MNILYCLSRALWLFIFPFILSRSPEWSPLLSCAPDGRCIPLNEAFHNSHIFSGHLMLRIMTYLWVSIPSCQKRKSTNQAGSGCWGLRSQSLASLFTAWVMNHMGKSESVSGEPQKTTLSFKKLDLEDEAQAQERGDSAPECVWVCRAGPLTRHWPPSAQCRREARRPQGELAISAGTDAFIITMFSSSSLAYMCYMGKGQRRNRGLFHLP